MAYNPRVQTILDFLVNDLLYDTDLRNLTPSDSLVKQGLLDSLAMLRTVEFCEECFGVQFDDADLVPDNFESVDTLAQLIEQYLAHNQSVEK
jgi:acyl carrier protein